MSLDINPQVNVTACRHTSIQKYINISIAFDKLPNLLEASWAVGAIQPRMKVTDIDAFADELRIVLTNEMDETGNTILNHMLDMAFQQCIDNGAEGIEEHYDQAEV
jgi:hypothetical protein